MENIWQKALNMQNALNSLTLEPKETDATRITKKILVGKVFSTRILNRFTFTEIINRIRNIKT